MITRFNENKETESYESPIKKELINLEEYKREFRKLNNINDKVKFILKKFPYSRRSYPYLTILFWNLNNEINFIPTNEDFVKMTSTEAISRESRKLFRQATKGENTGELNFLLLDDKILERKQEQEKRVHGYYSDQKLKPYKLQ